MTGDFEGSKLLRKILPSLVLFPIVSSYLLIVGVHQNIITIDFGLVAYAAIFITVGIIYLIFTDLGLNKTDAERQKLAMELQKTIAIT